MGTVRVHQYFYVLHVTVAALRGHRHVEVDPEGSAQCDAVRDQDTLQDHKIKAKPGGAEAGTRNRGEATSSGCERASRIASMLAVGGICPNPILGSQHK